MNRIRRVALVTGSALATLLLAVTAPFWHGRVSQAVAQYAAPAQAPSGTQAQGAASETPPSPADEGSKAGDTERKPAASKAKVKVKAKAGNGTAAKTAGATGADRTAPYMKPFPVQKEVPLAPVPTTQSPIAHIHGEYDIATLRRLIELARDSGFTEQQMREITVEDEHGNVVNAQAFLEDYEKRKKEQDARETAERNKVYLSPKDLIKELDKKQPADLDKLRDKMLFED